MNGMIRSAETQEKNANALILELNEAYFKFKPGYYTFATKYHEGLSGKQIDFCKMLSSCFNLKKQSILKEADFNQNYIRVELTAPWDATLITGVCSIVEKELLAIIT